MSNKYWVVWSSKGMWDQLYATREAAKLAVEESRLGAWEEGELVGNPGTPLLPMKWQDLRGWSGAKCTQCLCYWDCVQVTAPEE